jgi:hypothetical protein
LTGQNIVVYSFIEMNEELVMQVGQAGEFLWGRDRGCEIRITMEELLRKLPTNRTFVADLSAVAAMNYSVALELFVKLLSAWENLYPERGFLIRKPTIEVSEEIGVALEHHGLLALCESPTGGLRLVGKVSQSDVETVQWAENQGDFSAPDLAAALGLNLTTANQRLKKLEANGICIRYAVGSRQYRYRLAGR